MSKGSTNISPTGPGSPPGHLDDETRRLWEELAREVPAGACGPQDRFAFEVMVVLMRRVRDGRASSADAGKLVVLLTQFGLSPEGRQRLEWRAQEPKVSTRKEPRCARPRRG